MITGWVAVCLEDALQYRLKDSVLTPGEWRWTMKVRSCADRQHLLFSWAYSAKTVHPPPKLTHKRHILGMSTSPRNDSHCPKLCRLNGTPVTNTSSKVPIFSCFWGPVKPPAQKFAQFRYSIVMGLSHILRTSNFFYIHLAASVWFNVPLDT